MPSFRYTRSLEYDQGLFYVGSAMGAEWPDRDGDYRYETGDEGLNQTFYVGTTVIDNTLAPVFQSSSSGDAFSNYVVLYSGQPLQSDQIPDGITFPLREAFFFDEGATPTAVSQLFGRNPDAAQGLTAAYSVLLGGVPNQGGYKALIENAVASNFGAGPGPVFNAENVFINLINNLAQGNSAAKEAFNKIAAGSDLLGKVTSIYNFVIPSSSQTAEGLAFLTRDEGLAFYRQVAAERGVAGPEGAAIVALASLLKIAVVQNLGIGNNVTDLMQAVADGTHEIPVEGTNLTSLEIADGVRYDLDDGGTGAEGTSSLSIGLLGVAVDSPWIA